MVIEVMGAGCKKCSLLHELVLDAVAELGTGDEVSYVTDLEKIMSAGVLSTPALVIGGELRLAGRVPSKDELIRLIERAR